MTNGTPTISAGQVPRQPTRWEDLTVVTKALQPDGTYALATAAILYSSSGIALGTGLASAAFSLSSTGVVVPASVDHSIRVYAVKLICDPAAVVFWMQGAFDIEGPQTIVAGGGYVESVDPPAFLFETGENEDLILNVSGGGTASGRVSYWPELVG